MSRVRSSSGDIFGRGDFSLGVNMGSNSVPPKTPSDESINRGLVCAYMHFIVGECRQQKHTQHAPSTKTECDYLHGWIKKRSHTQKSHPKVNLRDIAGERKKKKIPKQNSSLMETQNSSLMETTHSLCELCRNFPDSLHLCLPILSLLYLFIKFL